MPISLTNKSKRRVKKKLFKEDNLKLSVLWNHHVQKICETEEKKFFINCFMLFFFFFRKKNIMKKHFHYRFAVAHRKAPIWNALTHSHKNKFSIFISHSFHWKFSSVGARSIFLVRFRHLKQAKRGAKKVNLFSHMRKNLLRTFH